MKLVRKWKRKKLKVTKLKEYQASLESSISEDLQSFNIEEIMDKQKMDALVIHEATFGEDIDDFIDKNDVENMLSIEEVDGKIQQIEKLRTAYRRKHGELKVLFCPNYEELYAEHDKANMVERDMSERKLMPDTKSIAPKKRSEEFLVEEFKITMIPLQSTLKTDFKQLSDDEVRVRKCGLLKLIERTKNLSKMVHNLLGCSNSIAEDEVDKLMANYSNISQLKDTYVKNVNNDVKSREVTEQELFNESRLRISLPKLSGYESKLNTYSFQSEFLRIYERLAPKQMMPSLLKNNFLEGSTLSLVKSMTDIEVICNRLKGAYGDSKLLQNKKLSQIGSISELWKIKGQKKLVDAF